MFADLSTMQKKEIRELYHSLLSKEFGTYIQKTAKYADVIKTDRKTNNLNTTGSSKINSKEHRNPLDTVLKLNVNKTF